MTVSLPPLAERALLADLCREAAAQEGVQPQLIEKDYYLTRLLWALGQHFRNGLLLKGGTLLSKVDLGFYRMSEDADFVLPGSPARASLPNARRMQSVRDALREIVPVVGLSAMFPAGELFEKATHGLWQLEYRSEFGPQGIKLEVTIRPLLRDPRKVRLRQLLQDSLAGDSGAAFCWALDAGEARAEKVRAASTRDAIRDYYDLEQLLDEGADLASSKFIGLVDAKLAELRAGPLREQARAFGMTEVRRRGLDASVSRELASALRGDAPTFDLAKMLARFDKLWRKRIPRGAP